MTMRWIFVLFALGLTACGTAPRSFQYFPPEDETALSCIEECKATAESCLAKEQQRYEECLRHNVFRRDPRHDNDCVRGYGASKGGTCTQERLCPGPDSYGCRLSYNDCYTECGGSVEPVK